MHWREVCLMSCCVQLLPETMWAHDNDLERPRSESLMVCQCSKWIDLPTEEDGTAVVAENNATKG